MEKIDQLDNDAIVIEPENHAVAIEKWQTARRLAEGEFQKTPTPEWSYVVGYLCYMLFARGVCAFAVAEKYLIGALSPGPKQRLAQFYLASLYFDTGRFRDAVQQLERIYKSGKEDLMKCGQAWRYVKSVEMLVAAKIRNDAWFDARIIGSQLEAIYREYEERESMIPLALVGALEHAAPQQPAYEELCHVAARIVRLTHSVRATNELFPGFSERWL